MNVADQLEVEEGRVKYAYRDNRPEGFLTIGVSRMVDKRLGGGLRDNEMDFMLNNDVAEKTAQVIAALPWSINLNEPRMAVLIQMCFQMGLGVPGQSGLLSFTRTLANIKAGQWSTAAQGMLSSLWAHQTPARATRLAKQMLSGTWV